MLSSVPAAVAAAFLEIAGCFALWSWLRLGKPAWWVIPGVACLIAFAWLLTRLDAVHAGRAFAAYGGVYIVCSMAWMWMVEGARPDRWDAAGAALCLFGAGLILFGPHDAT